MSYQADADTFGEQATTAADPNGQPVTDGAAMDLSGFSTRIADLRRQAGAEPSDDLLDALGELDVAQEELRVADEELNVQREQLEELLRLHRDEVVWRERLSSLLPMAVFVTSLEGMVLNANAAAGLVLHRPMTQLVHKPLPSFVVPEDRPSIRRAVSRLRHGDDVERLTMLVTPRKSEPVEVSVVGVPELRTSGQRVLRWVLLPARGAGATALSRADVWAHDLDTAAAFAEMCRLPLASQDRQVLLRQLSEVVCNGIPEADAVSITLGSPEEPEWVGSDSVLAQQVDGAQMISGEGPCAEAFRTREMVVTDDTTADDRWPAFAREAAASEVRSILAVPVSAGDDCLGVLNIYAHAAGAFDRRPRQVGALFGSAVSAVLQEVADRGSLSELAAQLEQAMQSRAVIDQAKGMIIAKYGGTPDEAFQRLATMSQRTNTKLRELARLLVEQAASGVRRG